MIQPGVVRFLLEDGRVVGLGLGRLVFFLVNSAAKREQRRVVRVFLNAVGCEFDRLGRVAERVGVADFVGKFLHGFRLAKGLAKHAGSRDEQGAQGASVSVHGVDVGRAAGPRQVRVGLAKRGWVGSFPACSRW